MQLTPDKAAGRSLGWADYLSFLRGTRGICPDDDTHLPRNARTFIVLLSYLYPSAILLYSSFTPPFVSFLWFVKRISITCQANQYNGQRKANIYGGYTEDPRYILGGCTLHARKGHGGGSEVKARCDEGLRF